MASAESRVLDIFATIFPLTALSLVRKNSLESIEQEIASRLVRSLYREFKHNPLAGNALEALFARVESSDSSLPVWLEQIVFVYDWLEQRQQTALFKDVVEYVSCSMHGSSSQQGHSVAWYLEQYGFEQSVGTK